MSTNHWLLVALVLVATYLFAQALSNLNEHFDASVPEIIETTVAGQHTRYTPFPIRVATVNDAHGKAYRVDVLPALAFSLNAGDSLSVVRKRGWLKKPWLQDEQRFDSLRSRRRAQGAVWLVVAAALAVAWMVVSARLRAVRLGLISLGLSFLLALAILLWVL